MLRSLVAAAEGVLPVTRESRDDAPTIRWTAPEPRAIPELRAALASHVRSDFAIDSTTHALRMGRGFAPPARSLSDAARTIHEEEVERLSAATLYMASADMTQLSVVAGESLPTFRMEPWDLPAPTGFIVFGQPIGSYVNHDAPVPTEVPIVAVTWGQYHRPYLTNMDQGGVWLTFYSPTDFDGIEKQMADVAGRAVRDRERARLRQLSGPLTWDNEAIIAYGADKPAKYARGSSFNAAPNKFAPWTQTVRAAWVLMSQQHISEMQTVELSRGARRRVERTGLPADPVHVIHLRRASNGTEDNRDGSGRSYTCRWMVRGHWRQQWYPSRGVHRPVWINPHVKGPDGKPLRTGDTMYLWDR